jgi:hypothetical protein
MIAKLTLRNMPQSTRLLIAMTATFASLTAAAIAADASPVKLNPSAATLPAGTLTIRPALDSSLLINPGKGFVEYDGTGFVEYDGSAAYPKSVIGVGYSRCDWSDLEPSEGIYNWSPIDKFIAAYAPYGLKIGWRVMNFDTGMGVQYATPAWVFKSGTNPQTGSVYPVGAASLALPDPSSPSGTQILPANLEDPVFLARMKEFIAAFGKKYNGNPNIAFLDIGNYGNSGEQNAFQIGNITPAQLKEDYFKPYFDAFPNTQLIVNTNNSDMYNEVYVWGVAQGAGARRDGICSKWSADGSQVLIAYPHAPAVLEYAYHWAGTVTSGTDPKTGFAWASPEELMKYVKGGRASYVQLFPEFYAANKEFCQMLGNKLGYHFILQEAELPSEIRADVPCQLRLKWLNDGVAPIYEPCYVAVALLDSNDHVVAREWLSGSDPKSWMPDEGKTETMQVTFSKVPEGIHKFAIGLFHDKKDANPLYKLGIQGRTAGGWYVLQ